MVSYRLLISVGLGVALALFLSVLMMRGFSADSQPSTAERNLANFAKDVVVPLEAKSRKNPYTSDAAALQEGVQIYQQACSVCHGNDGRSDIAFGRAMYPPAMDLTSPHVRSWSDAELFWIVQNGVRLTGMPAWRSMLDEAGTWKVIVAMRQLQQAGPKALPPQRADVAPVDRKREGELIFQQENCRGCHRIRGEGGKVGPDLSDEGGRNRSDAWMIGHFRNPAAYVKGSMMPATSNLNEEQLQSLTAYLQAQRTKR